MLWRNHPAKEEWQRKLFLLLQLRYLVISFLWGPSRMTICRCGRQQKHNFYPSQVHSYIISLRELGNVALSLPWHPFTDRFFHRQITVFVC